MLFYVNLQTFMSEIKVWNELLYKKLMPFWIETINTMALKILLKRQDLMYEN